MWRPCITPGCENGHHGRGVCERCYCALRAKIKRGEATDETLVEAGRWLRAKKKKSCAKGSLRKGGSRQAAVSLTRRR